MDEEKVLNEANPATETEPAPKPKRKRRTKAEIEADAKAAAAKAKREAKKAAKAAEKVLEGAVEEGARTVEKISKARIPTPAILVQYSGKEIDTAALTEAAVAQFREMKKRGRILDIRLYVKPEENAAYYVINDVFTGKIDL